MGPAGSTKTAEPGMLVKTINGANITGLVSLCQALNRPVDRRGVKYFVMETNSGDLTVVAMKHMGRAEGLPNCQRLLTQSPSKNITAEDSGNVTNSKNNSGLGGDDGSDQKDKLGSSLNGYSDESEANVKRPSKFHSDITSVNSILVQELGDMI